MYCAASYACNYRLGGKWRCISGRNEISIVKHGSKEVGMFTIIYLIYNEKRARHVIYGIKQSFTYSMLLSTMNALRYRLFCLYEMYVHCLVASCSNLSSSSFLIIDLMMHILQGIDFSGST